MWQSGSDAAAAAAAAARTHCYGPQRRRQPGSRRKGMSVDQLTLSSSSSSYRSFQHSSQSIPSLTPDDTIRDAVLTYAQKLTRVSLIYRTEPTTKKWTTEKLKSKKTDMRRSNGKQSGESVESIMKKKRKATMGRICRKGRF